MRSRLLPGIIILFVLATAILVFYIFRDESRIPLSRREPRKVDFIAENLTAKLQEIAKREDFTSDLSIPLFDNGMVSFHIHAMQVGQFCPLHFHKNSEEAVFIVQGKARVRSIVTDTTVPKSKRELKEVVLDKNSLFFAPPGSVHEFTNVSDEVLACLVIHTPPFQGNLYIKEESVEKSADVSFQNLSSMIDSMDGAGSGEVAVAKISTLYNVESRLMRTSSSLDQNMAKGYDLTIVYFGGEALLEIDGKKIQLAPTYFLGIPSGTVFKITPAKGSQGSSLLCFYLPPVSHS